VQDPDLEPQSNLHCVHFFEPSRFPAAEISKFLYEGLKQGEGAVLIASLEHASQIESEIEKRGLNVQQLSGAGLWVLTEVKELVQALESGMTAAVVVETFIELVVRPAQKLSEKQRVRIYGEFVDGILTQLRDAEMALEVERYGNELVSEGAATIYCGYSTNAFPDASFAKPFIRLCGLHTQVHNGLKDRDDWRFKMASKMSAV
jgi:MEDS: MEthanogen/methylotroph, DcmR Sensory domain